MITRRAFTAALSLTGLAAISGLSPWRFILLPGPAKAAFAAKLEALAESRGDARAAAKLAKLKVPPMGVAVVSSPKAGEIPEWEQVLSAGAVS